MTERLIYVVGPSGAGKDSVLQGLRETWVSMPPAHWARRSITRAAVPGGEPHESLGEGEFQRLLQEGLLAMHWRANGLSYGVRFSELAPLASGACVLVNGSRAYVPALLRAWPSCTLVHVTAPLEVLARRLEARGREDARAVADRLAREVTTELPARTIRISNDGPLAASVGALRDLLQQRLTQPQGVTP
jgi:ribose 1,5-bisphosphokinase